MLYAYLDESEFLFKGKAYIAKGILITEKPVSTSLIEDVLKKLEMHQNTLTISDPT